MCSAQWNVPKSLPDVHGGQPDPPPLPPATGDPRGRHRARPHPHPSRPVPVPVPRRRGPEASPGARARHRRCHKDKGGRVPFVAEAPQKLGRGGVVRGPAPHPRSRCQAGAAGRKGAVRWNLGAGGDGAARGGRARHVAAYVRRVQGRTARRPGHRGHRRGDTEPPPARSGGCEAGRPRVGLPTGILGIARPRGCAGVGGQGTRPRVCWSWGGQDRSGPSASPHRCWVSLSIPGCPLVALVPPQRCQPEVTNGSGGSSGTHAPGSSCAIDFSSTAAEWSWGWSWRWRGRVPVPTSAAGTRQGRCQGLATSPWGAQMWPRCGGVPVPTVAQMWGCPRSP